MCNIAALNLQAHGFSGRVIWGNSLSLDTWRVYEINMHRDIPIRAIKDTMYLRKQFEHKKPEIPVVETEKIRFVGDLFG